MNIEKCKNGQILRDSETHTVRAICCEGDTACSSKYVDNPEVIEFNTINNGNILELTPFEFMQICFSMCA